MLKRKENKVETVLFAFMGDVMIGRLVDEFITDQPSSYVWGNVLDILKSCDVRILNLETALTSCEEKVSKTFNFKADPKKVALLKKAQINLVNLANNHVLDFTEKGLIETLQTLKDANIAFVGAGRNFEEASQPHIFTTKGMKCAVLGCTDNEPTWKARKDHPGIFYVEIGNLSVIKDKIDQLRKTVDFIILSIHWGPNMRERPSKSFVQFAHQLIDLGVDLIHGHSAHIFQGIEIYKNRLILYDTGDFIDDYYVDPNLRNDRSFLFLVTMNKEKITRLELLPVLISNFQVNLAHGNEADKILKRMEFLSKELGTTLQLNPQTHTLFYDF